MMSSLGLFLLAFAAAPAADATPAINTTATVLVVVTDRHGKPLPAAHVLVNGLSERQGNTNTAGRVVFANMQTGDYVLRVEHDKFITFEKDFAVSANGGPVPVVAAVSPVASLTVRRHKAPASARAAVVSASSR